MMTRVLLLAGALLLPVNHGESTAVTTTSDSFSAASVPIAPAMAAMLVPLPRHAPGQSYIFLRVYNDSLVVRLELLASHVDSALHLGWNPNGKLTKAELEQQLATVRSYAESHFSLEAGGQRLNTVFRADSVRPVKFGDFVLLEYLITGPPPESVDITFSPFFELEDTHRNLLVVEHNWKTGVFNNELGVSAIYSPGNQKQSLDLNTSSTMRGFIALIRLGIWHIWFGFDHICFLMALILPSVLYRKDGQWQPATSFRNALFKILKIVTFFTIAHTITLSLAALDVVHLPSRLVESIIAASIVAAALHNLWPLQRVSEANIAFVFGLFHGFGFASVLGDIGLGREHLVLSLFGFNLGVEIGQVAIIGAVFPVLFFARRLGLYKWFMWIGSLGLISVGMMWLAERSLNIDIVVMPTIRAILHIITFGKYKGPS